MEPGPQFRQLAMFHTAKELIYDHTASDFADHPVGSPAWHAGWEQKEREVRNASNPLHADYQGWGHVPDAGKGIHTPVKVYHFSPDEDDPDEPVPGPALEDGHHRVAAAHMHNPNALVPVVHTDAAQIHHQFPGTRS